MELQPYNELMEKLRSKREKLGITQKKLAEDIGVSPSTMNRMEKGTLQPNYNTVYEVWRRLEEEENRATASVLMNTPIEWADADDTHREVATIMRENAYSQIPVRENGKLVGGITSEVLASNDDPDRSIRELMVDPFQDDLFGEVSSDAEREELEEQIEGRRALLVTDEDGEYVGIITHEDLL